MCIVFILKNKVLCLFVMGGSIPGRRHKKLVATGKRELGWGNSFIIKP